MSTAQGNSDYEVPAVSVILPTYNRRELLRQSIDSVLGQTFRDWELLVADDGSTDGTHDYLTALADARIRPLFLDHSGVAARARAAALRVARGRWVAFLDSDDMWLANKLSVQLAHLTAHPECQWGFTAYDLVDSGGKRGSSRPLGRWGHASGWVLRDLLTFEVSAAIQTVIVRRLLLNQADGFDETLGTHEDFDLTLRLAARSEATATSETLTLVRDHPHRTTSGRHPAELYATSERVFRKAESAATSKDIRALCIRQALRQRARAASALSRDGRHSAAAATLARGLWEAPLAAPVWRAAAGCTLRALRLRE